jgi:hypothetical protein
MMAERFEGPDCPHPLRIKKKRGARGLPGGTHTRKTESGTSGSTGQGNQHAAGGRSWFKLSPRLTDFQAV